VCPILRPSATPFFVLLTRVFLYNSSQHMIDNEKKQRNRMIGGASCHSDQLVLVSNGHVFSLVSSVSLFSPTPVGPPVVRCARENLFRCPMAAGQLGPPNGCPTCGEAAYRRGSLGSGSLTVQVLEFSELTKFSQVQEFPGHPMDSGSTRNAWPILAFRLLFPSLL
jgi:hypothetical protein